MNRIAPDGIYLLLVRLTQQQNRNHHILQMLLVKGQILLEYIAFCHQKAYNNIDINIDCDVPMKGSCI